MKKKLFSMLLVLSLVLTMATSVSAHVYNVSFDEAEYSTPILPDDNFDDANYADTAYAPANWSAAQAWRNAEDLVRTANEAIEDEASKYPKLIGPYQDLTDTENSSVVWKISSYAKGYCGATDNSNGKTFNTTNYTGELYDEIMLSFDFKNFGMNFQVYLTPNIDGGTSWSTSERKLIFGISSSGGIYGRYYNTAEGKAASGTSVSFDEDSWHNAKLFLNKTLNSYMLFLDGNLVTYVTGEECSKLFGDVTGVTGIRLYTSSSTTGPYILLDNFKYHTKTAKFDSSVHNIPEYYPDNMTYFETFNNSYIDQPVTTGEDGKKVLLTTSNSGAGTVTKDTANWLISDAGHLTGFTFHPYAEGGKDKYMLVNYNTDSVSSSGLNDNYFFLKYKKADGSPLIFKTLNPIITETEETDEDGNPVTEITGYNEPTFHDDVRFVYTTYCVGGLDTAYTAGNGTNADYSYNKSFYFRYDLYDENEAAKRNEIYQLYTGVDKFGSTAGNLIMSLAGETPGKMYKVDMITDTHTGNTLIYIDGRLARNSTSGMFTAADVVNSVMMRRIAFGSRHTDGLKLDNLGYKIYPKTADGAEITIEDVIADVFATPRMHSCEILSTSNKEQLDVLVRASGVTAECEPAGDVIIATYSGNRLTNVFYGQTRAIGTNPGRFGATFTNELANTDKVACYFLGAKGTDKYMQPIVDAVVFDYNNASYPDAPVAE